MRKRCEWPTDEKIYLQYHDKEWGVPVYDDRKLFEMLIHQGSQAGLRWITILKRRANYRKAYDNFDPESSHVIPALITKFHNAKTNRLGSVTVWGDSSASREFLYAGDCAEAIEKALLNYNSSEPVNIGTGSEITIKDLTTKVAELVGYEGHIIYDKSKPNGQPRRCLDTSKAEKEFNFKAKTSLKEGLEKTYSWYINS